MIDLILIVMLGTFAILLPIVFFVLDTIEAKIETKFGDISRRRFVSWTGIVSIGFLILSLLGIILSIYLDPPFK